MPSLRSRTARWVVALRAIGLVVVASLAASATTSVASAAPPLDDAAVQRAIDGFHSYVLRNATAAPVVEPCPLLTPEQLGWYTQQWNIAPSTQGYAIDIGRNPELGDNVSLYCGVDLEAVAAAPEPATPYGIALEVSHLLGEASFDSVLATDDGAVLVPEVPRAGGVLGGWCDAGANGVCLLRWSRNELLVSFAIVGPPSGVQQQAIVDMFAAMLPEILTNLGAAYQDTGGPTTLPSLPPLPDNQPTVPPSAAPATTAAATAAATTVAPATTAAATTAPATTAAPVTTAATAAPVTTAAPATTAAVPTVPPTPTTAAATTAAPTTAAPTEPPTSTVAVPTVPPAPTTAGATTVPVPTAPPPSPSMAVPTTSEPAGAPGPDELPDGAFAEGAPTVPAATEGEVSVVLDAPIAANGVAFVVRNGTDEPIHDVEVSAVVRDADGRLVAAGAAAVVPGEIVPGGWAMGAVRFGHDALAGDVEVELAVTRTASGPSPDRIPLTVTDATFAENGELTATAEGDAGHGDAARASVACFDDGELTGVFSDEILADAPSPDTPIPVSIGVPADVACAAWIVVAEA